MGKEGRTLCLVLSLPPLLHGRPRLPRRIGQGGPSQGHHGGAPRPPRPSRQLRLVGKGQGGRASRITTTARRLHLANLHRRLRPTGRMAERGAAAERVGARQRDGARGGVTPILTPTLRASGRHLQPAPMTSHHLLHTTHVKPNSEKQNLKILPKTRSI